MADLPELIKQHNALVRTNFKDRWCYRDVCANCEKNDEKDSFLPPAQQDAELGNTEQDERSSDQSVIPPSLGWRFVGWLGGLALMLNNAPEMILKQNPNSLCHRVDGSVDPDKARSDERLHRLETARQLLLIIPEWEELHGCKFFPRFATRSGFD